MSITVTTEDAKRGDTFRPYPEDVLYDWKDNGRFDEPDPALVTSKRLSLEQHGQISPVKYGLTHDRKLKLVAGFYRLLGMLEHNKMFPDKRMRLEGTVKTANPEALFLVNIAENRDHNATTVVDDAHNAVRLSEVFSKTDEEICLIFSQGQNEDGTKKPMSPAWLENMRKIVRLPKEIQQQIARKQLSASIGYLLADMDPAEHATVLQDAAAEGTGKVTATSVLKAARKSGALSKSPALKMPEVKTAWQYLADNDKEKYPKVAKLAAIVQDWQAGKLPEPDFYQMLHRLVGA